MNSLRSAISAYHELIGTELTDASQAVISRLEADSGSVMAFEKLSTNTGGLARIIVACIEADELLRTFRNQLNTETEMRKRLAALDSAAADLLSFVEETQRPRSDRLSALIQDDPQTIADMIRGISLVRGLIGSRNRLTIETPLRLGATRKTKDEAAAIAAIGWLAEGVRRICGQPHTEATADLCQALLGYEVSLDRVREAERTRRDREWRVCDQ